MLADIDTPSQLWRAEARLGTVVESDGLRLLRGSLPGPDIVLGAFAAIAVEPGAFARPWPPPRPRRARARSDSRWPMSWRDGLTPARMERVGLVAPAEQARTMLAAVARSASVELELPRTTGESRTNWSARSRTA
ncbi:MAG: hypothetical protein WDM88_06135 [Galbitalea sp.]